MYDTVSIEEFLYESNAIENVHDDDALEAALSAWEYLTNQDSISHETVKETHKILLEDRQPDIAGEYRSVQVRVGSDVPPHPTIVEDLIDDLLDRVPSTGAEAIQWHVDFEKIHPFADGNGRVGRLLYAWHCRSVLDIDPVMWRADDVSGYYALFQTADTPGT